MSVAATMTFAKLLLMSIPKHFFKCLLLASVTHLFDSRVTVVQESLSTNFSRADYKVFHMEIDQFLPVYIIFTDRYSLKTTDGTILNLWQGKLAP